MEFTKKEAYAVAEFIDGNIFDAIRNDTDWDSFQNLRNLVHAYEKCGFKRSETHMFEMKADKAERRGKQDG